MEIYLIIIISLLFSAFFSGMEIAYISSNKLRFELEKSQSHATDFFLSIFYRYPEQFITTTLVGNNIALVIFSIMTAQLMHPLLLTVTSSDLFITLIETALATAFILLAGEYIPKIIFRSNPNLWLRIFSPLFFLFYIVLYPISKISVWVSIFLLRTVGVKVNSKHHHVFSRIDLDHLIQESIDHQDDEQDLDTEVKIFQNALDFSSVKLRDCMVPRTEIVAIDEAEASLQQLKQLFIETGHSKILIYKNNIDSIIGSIHSSEMLRHPDSWTEHVNDVPIVPETMQANKLMKLFNQQKKSIAVVVDEYGGTAGIVTLEDILEEIFGEIEDEHDRSGLIAKKLENGDYVLSGRMEIDQVNELFDLGIPESDEYSTIAGFILSHYQNLPKANETIKVMHFTFRILKVENNRIDLVKLTLN
ncbi:hemolysin family protein [Paludibacter sp.]|uniref:hemolysin family protein n=1 Tax=Paludibacter sp. TaxID=1898105 RepID=UPI00135512B5|nr:hemolysin family protein [Paludibacter sp.]MTK53390.1 HlyC/CorC family transporter [Paludibacter sp.]